MVRGYFDGAARGNPGEAGAGACLVDEDEKLVWECAEYLGERTNNEAEYHALLLLLGEMRRRGLFETPVFGDSRLVIKQVLGKWKVREPRLKPLAEKAKELVRTLRAKPQWIPRSENMLADGLSNRAIDESKKPRVAEAAGVSIRKAGKDIFVVCDGKEEYAVDLRHQRCTCGRFDKEGTCRHMEAALDVRTKRS